MSASSLSYLFAQVRVVFIVLCFFFLHFLQKKKTQNNKHCPDAEHFAVFFTL